MKPDKSLKLCFLLFLLVCMLPEVYACVTPSTTGSYINVGNRGAFPMVDYDICPGTYVYDSPAFSSGYIFYAHGNVRILCNGATFISHGIGKFVRGEDALYTDNIEIHDCNLAGFTDYAIDLNEDDHRIEGVTIVGNGPGSSSRGIVVGGMMGTNGDNIVIKDVTISHVSWGIDITSANSQIDSLTMNNIGSAGIVTRINNIDVFDSVFTNMGTAYAVRTDPGSSNIRTYRNRIYEGSGAQSSNNNGCVSGQGNYYGITVPTLIFNDCGPVILTTPAPATEFEFNDNIILTWTAQWSPYPILYYIDFNDGSGWTNIGSTSSLTYSFSAVPYYPGSYQARVRPNDGFYDGTAKAVSFNILSPCTVDPDGDGFGTGNPPPDCMPDNCPTVFNPGQEDSDFDGIGDACEVPCYTPDPDGNNNVLMADTTFCPGIYNVAPGATTGAAIMLGADNINVNCDGAKIVGTGTGTGILVASDGADLFGCVVDGYSKGVHISDIGSANEVYQMFINNTDYGYYLEDDHNLLHDSIFNNMSITSIYADPATKDNYMYFHHFWDKGIDVGNRQGLCVDLGAGVFEGNFYEEDILDIDEDDCGPINQTSLLSYMNFNDKLTFNWTRQSHISSTDFKYFIDLSNNSGLKWVNIGNTTDLNFTFDTDDHNDGPNYMLRVRPFDGYYNGTPFYTSMFGVGKNSTLLGYTYMCKEQAEEPGQKIANVTVVSMGTPFMDISDENGTFNLSGLPPGIHTIIAYKDGHMSKWNVTVEIFPGAIKNADFELCPIDITCQDDCTLLGSNRCEPLCDGIAGCEFNFVDRCENLAKGTKVRHNLTHQAICCERDYKYATYTPALNISVDATDIVTLTKIINFRDEFKYLVGAKIKIIVFDKKR